MKINEVGECIQECLRLLYWVYFKPYTLQKWLQDIDPELELDTDPFSLRSELRQNPKLQRYANQTWLLTAIIPSSLAMAFIVNLDRISSFNSLLNGSLHRIFITTVFTLFLLGWILVSHIRTIGIVKWSGWTILLLFIFAGTFFLFRYNSLILSKLLQEVIKKPPFLSLMPGFSVLAWSIGIYFGTVSRTRIKGVGLLYVILLTIVIRGSHIISETYYLFPSCIFGFIIGSIILNLVDEIKKRNSLLDWLDESYILSEDDVKSFKRSSQYLLGISFLFLAAMLLLVSSVLLIIPMTLTWRISVGVSIIFGAFPIYLWIPEFVWMILVEISVLQGKRASSVLCKLPPYFDQNIIMPLPYVATIITKAYRENPIAARSTIDYFITSTNQQAVAKKAMFGIGIETLNQCRYVSDIIGSQIQLDWLPTDEKTFGKVLPRLLEISHNIDIAYQATTAYNKLELVDRSISDLQKLQTSLSTAAATSDAPLFGTITMRWLQILQDNRQALETAAQASAEIPNPYLAGSSLEPADAKERFKGRQDLFREIEKISLSAQPPVLLLYGRRRTGKTSTLKYLPI
jgi:uncharacterized protein